MSEEIIIYKTDNVVEVTEEVNDVTIASIGVQGPPGPAGADGAPGPAGADGEMGPPGTSGIIAVNDPIINTGTTSSANLSFSPSPIFSGIVTASGFSGDGSGLSPIAGSAVTGSVNNAINSLSANYSIYSSSSDYSTNAGSSVYSTSALYSASSQYSVNTGSSVYTSSAIYASSAAFSTIAASSTYATNSGSSIFSTNSTNSLSANYATNAGSSIYATNAGSSNYSINASFAINAASAEYASVSDMSQQVHVYVKNTSGSTLYKGQAVYITGAQGANIEIGLAQANTESKSSKTLGLLEQNLNNNQFGYVATDGILNGVDTSQAGNEGDPIWLSPTTPGGLIYGLVNKPYAPNHLVYLGVVTRKNQNNGQIFVHVQNGFEMQELHNVSAQYPADGDVLVYNASSSLWVSSSGLSGLNLSFADINSSSFSISNNIQNIVDHFDSSLYTTVEYSLQMRQGSTIRSSKLYMINDNNGTIHFTEHSILETGEIPVLIEPIKELTTGQVRLILTCSGATAINPINIKIYRTLLKT